MNLRFHLSLIASLTVACSSLPAQPAADTVLAATAQRIAHETIVVDTHIDLPFRLERKWEDITQPTAGDFDEPRARQGGLDAAFMSVYLPPEDEEHGTATDHAEALIDLVNRIASTWPDKFAVAVSSRDVRTNTARGLISLCMGMENAAPIAGRLENVRHFYDRGIRYITLCHTKDNHVCDSSGDTTHTWKGLSPFGRQLVAEMNRVGIMVDVSHISDDAFFQVVALSKAPVIASHSACRAFTPGFQRNMSDDMIRLLAANGGIIMVNFGSEFVNGRFSKWEDQRLTAIHSFMQERHTTYHDSLTQDFAKQWRTEHPPEYADVSEVAATIDHIARLVGVDHVGFGSDFEGLGDQLPSGLKDVSMYPNVIAELLKLGYSDGDVRKVCGENLLRVWDAVAKRADELREVR